MEVEAEAAKFFEEKSGSGSGSGAKDLEAEAFLGKKLQTEVEAIFFQKNFGSRSGSEFFFKKILEAEAEAFSKSSASKTPTTTT